MANLQAVGFDGESIIYLLADGTGTELDPYISKYKLVDQDLLATDAGLTAIANAISEFTFDGTRLTVKTELDQPLTLAQLETLTIKVEEQFPLNIDGLAKDATLTEISDKIPGFSFSGSRLNVDVELEQPLTLTQLQSLIIPVQEQDPLDVSGLAQQLTLAALSDKIALTGDRIKVDIGLSQGITNDQLRASPIPVSFDLSSLATKLNQDTTNTTLSSLNTKLPSGLTVSSTRLLVDGSGVTQPISGTITANQGGNWDIRNITGSIPLATNAATADNQSIINTRLGDIAESPPATDTASSGLNGRLIRLAQRITTLIGLLPSSLGAKTAANSFPVTLASDGVASGIANQIGEVQASPTANTILDRLKAIFTAVSSPTTYTVTTICLTTALSEGSLSLTSARVITCYSRTNTVFRISTTAGNTVNTQNFEIVQAGNEYYQDGINFTGILYFSAESLPTAITVASCSTTNGSPTVTSSNSFSSLTIGQAVSGSGIPANTFVIRRAADGLSITLGDANGNTVNATANGTVTLTFSGAVIRISRWT